MTALTNGTQVKPRICVSFDRNHKDDKEMAISTKLEQLSPEKKIIFFQEGKFTDQLSLGQYSIELLGFNSTRSSASPAKLLLFHTMIGSGETDFFRGVLGIMYTDPYMKKLFVEDLYKGYTPQKYNLCTEPVAPHFSFAHTSERDIRTINQVKGLFKYLDENLPKQIEAQADDFLTMAIIECAKALLDKSRYNMDLFGPITEALAVIKIAKIQKTSGDKHDSNKELTLDFVKKLLYQNDEAQKEALTELNLHYRTLFHVEKVQTVIKKILQKEGAANEYIFLARVGFGHREKFLKGLHNAFGADSVKEVNLLGQPLGSLDKAVKECFA